MIPSSFGRKIPRGPGRPTQKKNPLGERVAPPTKNAPQSKNPLGERAEPPLKEAKASVSGQRVQPGVKKPGLPSTKDAMRRLGTRVQPQLKVPLDLTRPQIVPPQPSRPASAGPEPRSGIAVVGRFVPWPWRQHPDESYLADALERLGVVIHRVNQDLPRPPLKQAEWALFTGHPGSIARLDIWRKTHPTIVWTLDWLPDLPERRSIIEAGRRATLFLSSDQYNWAASFGLRNHGYLPGACESVVAPFSPKPTIPCAFIGSLYSPRRKQIAAIVRKHGGIVLDQAGSWKYGVELSSWLQTIKVIVGDSFRNDVQGYWSTRNYIVPGAGGFLLTPRTPGLELQFKINREVAIYDSMDELDAQLDYWIKNDQERERVRRAGYDRTRREHSWDNRAKALLMHLAGRINAAP